MSIVSPLARIFIFVAISVSMVSCDNVPQRKNLTGSTDQSPASTSAPTLSTLPEPLSTPVTIQSTVPQDPDLDAACRQTIEEYHTIPCEDWEVLRDLYTLSRQSGITPDTWSCSVVISRTLLSLMPASEWWQLHSDEPLPRSASPTAPNEYVYFVEFWLYWVSGAIPTGENPFSHLMWMVSDANEGCKIKEYGW